MHWIQTIRETLELSQAELAHYLRLSVHMIKSVETDRRELPNDSLMPAITLYKAMKDFQASGPVSDPTVATDSQMRHMKRLYRECRRKLDRCSGKLEKMERTHTSACFCLGFYQFLAQFLTALPGETDLGCQRWIQLQIEETTQRIKDNNAITKDMLTAKITGLKSMMQALEGSRFFISG